MTQGRLYQKRIVVTRSSHQAADLTGILQQEGAIVYEIPSIEIVESAEGLSMLTKALDHISSYAWLVLTSVNSVQILDKTLKERARDWSVFQKTKIGCIGKATARKVDELGGSVSIMPGQFRAEALAAELLQQDLEGLKILLPRAAGSRPVLPQLLQEAGAIVTEIHIYKAELASQNKDDLERILKEPIDFLTFTSSSTVRNFAELAGKLQWQRIPVACIGPITAETLREYGIEPVVEAEEFTIQGLADAIIQKVQGNETGLL